MNFLTILLFSAILFITTSSAQIIFTDSGKNFGNGTIWDIAFSDIDLDGDLDVVILSDQIEVWKNNGDGSLTKSQNIDADANAVDLGDLNGDGYPDAFIVYPGQYTGHPAEVWINDKQGNFTNSGQRLGQRFGTDIVLADLDNDGDLDAFVCNHTMYINGQFVNGGHQIWFNDGTGHFYDSGQDLGNQYHISLALGDIDNDGDLDAVSAAYSNYNGAVNENTIWQNDGTGHFTTKIILSSPFSQYICLGDIDGDTDKDIVIAYQDGVKIYLNDGHGNFTMSTYNLDNTTGCVGLGDLDRDGDLDLIVKNNIWSNDGSGIFVKSEFSFDSNAEFKKLADIDNNGDLDAIVDNKIWFNTTNQTGTPNIKNKISDYKLDQNYPNPFNPSTTIKYSLAKSSHIKLTVYNILGQKIKTLVNSFQSAGEHSITWDAMDAGNNQMSSGVYFYKLESNQQTLQKKMLLVR